LRTVADQRRHVGWQNQAWYFYDSVGELWFAFNWLASAVSRATLYAAEIDPDTGLVTGPTEDARAQAVAAQILGGADETAHTVLALAHARDHKAGGVHRTVDVGDDDGGR
jgi:hypothetical protein